VSGQRVTIRKKYSKLHRFREAAEQFQEYIWLNPNDPAGHHSLGMSYCKLGEFALAIAYKSRLQTA